jgi:KaiC/GvpD/RAD55 family RecA-like ATPase
MVKKDKTKITIEDLLKASQHGNTISDIMKQTKLSRHTVLARLHRLVGENKVGVRQINMAKVHFWIKENNVPTEHPVAQEALKAAKKIKLQPLEKKHISKAPPKLAAPDVPAKPRGTETTETDDAPFDMAAIKAQIQQDLGAGTLKKHEAQVKEQRAPITHTVDTAKHAPDHKPDEFITTGVPGFDELFEQGIPKGNSILVAGGAGSGKTLLTLQTLYNHARDGDNCLYMSFEESEEKLIHHMEDFGWDPKPFIKKGNLLLKRFNPFEITRSVDALLLEAKGELLIKVDPVIFPHNFQPDIVVVDSLTAIASAFTGKEDSYRIYIEQLFRFFEKIGATSFLITETKQIPTVYSTTGVEEFLADGVVVLYNFKRGNVRENAIEVLKLRGAKHQKKIVAMQITDSGVVVYPEQEVFGSLDAEQESAR